MKPSSRPTVRPGGRTPAVAAPASARASQQDIGDEGNDAASVTKRPALSLNLFWRTFSLMAALLFLCAGGSLLAWRQLEMAPLAEQTAQQLASVVRLSSMAARHAEGVRRPQVIKALRDEEDVGIAARSNTDTWEPLATDHFTRLVTTELQNRLGADTVVARSVNGLPGLWVSFAIEQDTYWLQASLSRLDTGGDPYAAAWLSLALLLMLGLAMAVAHAINRPMRDLSFAATKVREGDYESTLSETNITTEIRAVNIGFNRMAQKLAKVEEERAVMLAGISHDLRTPLARLRLEAEISVSDEDARHNMAMDIDQLDAIIDKFMDYARPDGAKTVPVELASVVEREAAAFRDKTQIRFSLRLPPALRVIGDDTELGRVFANLFENARRYGRTAETGIAKVRVSHVMAGDTVIITVRDFGPGVPHEKLPQLTTPFFRGDAARTAANGAGLGLAIVQKALQRIGGSLELANARDGGLMAHIRLKRA